MASNAAAAIQGTALDFGTIRRIRANKAKLPPSPRLSARMVTSTYLTVTTRISAHTRHREDAKDMGLVQRELVATDKAVLKGVERAGFLYRRTRRRLQPAKVSSYCREPPQITNLSLRSKFDLR